ncbi:arginyl-tRNA synthetase [Clostridium acetobutylicum]|uniref:Arginine--tRNA ligase n=1 Tax=Clostridium acetobutylicum (strain ATCC 824 / DSM 792 / JCM 1419 / IAM 19013 / LMG 5710 / NBRC 13948 / NRRL B-527 / VKM B-1787 / 2291 / W) TaxID=272562 RepID=SYR_CLOAB|nr:MULTISPECIES: arginine--tRNA ligase [Clostridium]Q97K78.1 RecName: Full=Arginine--tRNA ligase; AltName: Full=Arginyl-tRNA synthetase; Short=ArgRS [Clostridium acetobutylicum ATCC 824]AAK79017.1 Arginyl-tRNA synthetase [Clostridium acetobutylicum ATCC 824]ADZ20092.1 arginyl-tRNA synthetase [Clostridium acetobutylicum EA 2018]AEI33129.1 arginyl-tRNA synthetase [Clostridium acetobutylicum DSM 1731]AWV81727.1 arginine--tRNA ligase [Clostridium acetobutylicum]MBC2395269.1 arginine--tRNA ligase 
MDYKKVIAERINKIVDMDVEALYKIIEIPPKKDMGDFALPCFQFAKVLRKAPNAIAEEVCKKIDQSGFEKVENLGPYINFFVDKADFAKETIESVLSERDNYGRSKVGEGKKVLIEYSSPNIAKPFHVGHLFGTVLGSSLYKIFSMEGYDCVRINHLGDWGTQFGKLISAYKRWCDEDALYKDPIKELLRIYVKFHKEAEKDPLLEDEGRMYFKRLEDGEKEEVELWTKFKDLSLREFKKVYNQIGVEFDSYTGESFYSDKIDAIEEELNEKGLLTESNGAKVVMLDEYNMPPCIIKKADGASIYATRDLAAAEYRKKTYNFDKSIYVVGLEQSLHFKQFLKTLELAGHEWSKDCIHVGYGLVRFAEGKLSTRNGDVIFLEDLLKESVQKTSEIIEEKNPELDNKEEVSRKVGIGAVIFTYLKNGRERDIIFDWKEMLSFEGETGPYVQYSYARAKSILRKLGEVKGNVSYDKLVSAEEFDLIKQLKGFNGAILNAIDRLEPSVITRYVIEVAKAFNKFYNAYNISNTSDEELKNARLALVEAASIVIKNALSLIGIDVVEEM